MNYGYDDILVFSNDGKPLIGQPAFLNESKENPELFINYSIFYQHSKEEIESKLGCSFPCTIQPELSELSLYNRTIGELYDSTRIDTVSTYLEENTKFLYPVVIFSNDFFLSYPPRLPDEVLTALGRGLCKVLFLYGTEGHGLNLEVFDWIYEFSKTNNLTKTNFLFLSGNLLIKEYLKSYELLTKRAGFVSVEEDYHFELDLWFVKGGMCSENTRRNLWMQLEDGMKHLQKRNITKHFLCFNRRPHLHRITLVGQILASEKLKTTSIVSLGRDHYEGEGNRKKKMILNSSFCYTNRENFLSTVEKLDLSTDLKVDINSEINPAADINFDAHSSTFVNVVTETLVAPDSIFFSEKIFKPIYMLQPFILLGNPGSLKKLKEMGYRTFDEWWSEDYDDCLCFNDRINYIVKIMEEISTWPIDTLPGILKEMESVLYHNFTMLLDRSRRTETIKALLS